MRQALGLSIPALNFSQSTLFAYNYRADGKPSSLVSAIGYGNKTFAWTYTAAGRELTQSDPLTGAQVYGNDISLVPETYTYDSYGRVNTLQLPRSLNQLQSFTYDAEGNAVNFQTGVTPYPYVYTARNETWGPNRLWPRCQRCTVYAREQLHDGFALEPTTLRYRVLHAAGRLNGNGDAYLFVRRCRARNERCLADVQRFRCDRAHVRHRQSRRANDRERKL